MKLPESAHTEQPWRIHEIAPDFRIEDVWSFRTPGAGPDDFPAMIEALREISGQASWPTRFLFAIRWKLGAIFGWDSPQEGFNGRVRSLRERLPPEMRDVPLRAEFDLIPFKNVYELENEFVQELANKTVHDLTHLGWVRTESGEYELRMAALVKPNGLFGRLYMAAIAPFRYLIVYPSLTRRWERAWLEIALPQISKS